MTPINTVVPWGGSSQHLTCCSLQHSPHVSYCDGRSGSAILEYGGVHSKRIPKACCLLGSFKESSVLFIFKFASLVLSLSHSTELNSNFIVFFLLLTYFVSFLSCFTPRCTATSPQHLHPEIPWPRPGSFHREHRTYAPLLHYLTWTGAITQPPTLRVNLRSGPKGNEDMNRRYWEIGKKKTELHILNWIVLSSPRILSILYIVLPFLALCSITHSISDIN